MFTIHNIKIFLIQLTYPGAHFHIIIYFEYAYN